eukprot:6145537-Pyramimonas_sp.AAC.1
MASVPGAPFRQFHLQTRTYAEECQSHDVSFVRVAEGGLAEYDEEAEEDKVDESDMQRQSQGEMQTR